MEFEWLAYLSPLLYIFIGLSIKIIKPSYSPNGKNHLVSGVRFREALKSEEKWNYAQRAGSNMLIIGGIIDFIIMQIVLRLCINNVITVKQFENFATTIGVLIFVFVAMVLNYKTKRIG